MADQMQPSLLYESSSVQYVLRLHGRIKITSMMRFLVQEKRKTKGFCACNAFQPFPSLGLCGFQMGRCQPPAQQQERKRHSAPFAQASCPHTDPTHCLYSLKLFCSQLLLASLLFYSTFPQEHSTNNILVQYIGIKHLVSSLGPDSAHLAL